MQNALMWCLLNVYMGMNWTRRGNWMAMRRVACAFFFFNFFFWHLSMHRIGQTIPWWARAPASDIRLPLNDTKAHWAPNGPICSSEWVSVCAPCADFPSYARNVSDPPPLPQLPNPDSSTNSSLLKSDTLLSNESINSKLIMKKQ